MTDSKIDEKTLQLLRSVRGKRASIVIEHILKHGYITTEELEEKYGYNHPPRAARDVREAGIPLVTFRVRSSDGRPIAAYRFGDLSNVRQGRLGGRRVFPKSFKVELYSSSSGKCAICTGSFDSRYLQIDHRVPYEVAGDVDLLELKPSDFILLCGSCNRAKSWSCENCPNWQTEKSTVICSTCYWANPSDYIHIALREIRRLDILWDNEDIETYKKLKAKAIRADVTIPNFVKILIRDHLDDY